MKQILFLIILAAVGYFVFWGGTTYVLHKADINPKSLVSNIVAGVDENFLPEIDPARTGFRFVASDSYNRIKQNIFMNYDPDVCFAFLDLVYSSGYQDSQAVVKEYFKMFVMPEDQERALNLFSTYKDKQTLNILLSLYGSEEIIDKSVILKPLSNYHTPEVAKIIKEATFSEDPTLSEKARTIAATLEDKKWYTEGLKANPVDGSNFNLDLSFNKNHLGQQYHSGSDFENKMGQY